MNRTTSAVPQRRADADRDPSTQDPFKKLYRELAPKIRTRLRKLGVADEDLDDVLQEVWKASARNPEALVKANNPAGWLYRVAKRRAADYVRAKQRARKRPAPPTPIQDLRTSLSSRVGWKQVLARSYERLQELDGQILNLWFEERLPTADIVRILGERGVQNSEGKPLTTSAVDKRILRVIVPVLLELLEATPARPVRASIEPTR
jgi:DNA-directed RNA polymerase specialized sigma24 family protein